MEVILSFKAFGSLLLAVLTFGCDYVDEEPNHLVLWLLI